MLCLHQGIVESHLAVLGRKFAGNEKALQQLYFQDLREERWERECVELYLKADAQYQTSPSPTSRLWLRATLTLRGVGGRVSTVKTEGIVLEPHISHT
jgi:hypothetical protein